MKAIYKTIKIGDKLTNRQLASISRRVAELSDQNDNLDPDHYYDSIQLNNNIAELIHLESILKASIIECRKSKLGLKLIKGGV